MGDIFEQINENAKRVEAEAREERLRYFQAKRKKANMQMLIRTIISVVLVVALYLAAKLGLMVSGLSITLTAGIFVWLAFWLGAWVQFAWCKGGLLR